MIFLFNLYFSLGYTAKDSSFYASLHAEFVPNDQEVSQKMVVSNNDTIVNYGFVKFYSPFQKILQKISKVFLNFKYSIL